METKIMLLDTKFFVLSNSQRRQLLHTLNEDDIYNTSTEPMNAVETNGGEREHAAALYHVHLPRLEDHGLITWNQETGDVTKGPQFDKIEPLLDTLTETSDTQAADDPPA
jgi:hypothetical protein